MNRTTKSNYPVSLSEVKTHLRIDASNNEDDTYLTNSVIKSATRKAENFIDKAIAYTSNVYTINDFYSNWLQIPEGNLISLDHIISDTSTALTYDELVVSDDKFQIEFATTIDSDPLTIQFTTGYDSSTNPCPEDIKQAIFIECGNLYDVERSSYTFASNKKGDVFERLLMPYKTIRW